MSVSQDKNKESVVNVDDKLAVNEVAPSQESTQQQDKASTDKKQKGDKRPLMSPECIICK